MPPPEGYMGNRDLVIPPNTFAYVLDNTKGKVNVYVGPNKNSLSETDRLVVWDGRRFVPVESMDQAIKTFAIAGEGHYIVLENPAPENSHPPRGAAPDAVDLEVGRKVNIPGPATFALWPGQVSKTVEGHHLRHNQYLIVRVYDAEQAQENWGQAVIAAQGDGGEEASDQVAPQDFTMGQLMVIRGTDVSFYIPPTGIEVVPDPQTNAYVREAVTLERLEYCILLDESGEKRYVQGPDVVFPSPTEKFLKNQVENEIIEVPGATPRSDKSRKFRAIELNEHSGIYVKVIDAYEDEDGEHPVGEELFITGDKSPIYFPRAEHSIIKYGDRQVHYAIAIPEGEGRYVLNRDTGDVRLEKGPSMFLPDPRHEVVVLRTLSDKMVELLYPGNQEARLINEEYRMASQREAGDRSPLRAASVRALAGSESLGSHEHATYAGISNVPTGGDSFSRSTSYSQPRSITLDTKYDGAVTISIWPGYAILVTDRAGGRRVEVGPKTVLLEYDEIVQPVELSTGRPKTDTRLLRTAYLRVGNNTVSDLVKVQTKDLVEVEIELSYRATFEAETEDEMLQWFDVENYVKFMTDHARSRLRNAAKRTGIQDFYTNTIDIVRDALLGTASDHGRKGLVFEENGLRVYDVEILNIEIADDDVARILTGAQYEALQGAIEVSQAADRADRRVALEGYSRIEMDEAEATALRRDEIAMDVLRRSIESNLARLAADLEDAEGRNKVAIKRLELDRASAETDIAITVLRDEARLSAMKDETDLFVQRVQAISEDMIAALHNFGDMDFVQKLVEAVGPVAMSTGVTSGDLLARVFEGTPFAGVLDNLNERPMARRVAIDATPDF